VVAVISGRVLSKKIIYKKIRYWYLVSLPIRGFRPVGPIL
jgi:hypothetical protein